MKVFALIAIFTFSGATFSSVTSLTPAQSKNVLGLIDNLCGDVWCEGIYQYNFKSLECDFLKSECSLSFSYYENSDLETSKNAVCIMDGLSSYSDLVVSDRQGYDDLNDKFYWQLTNTCFDTNAESWTVR